MAVLVHDHAALTNTRWEPDKERDARRKRVARLTPAQKAALADYTTKEATTIHTMFCGHCGQADHLRCPGDCACDDVFHEPSGDLLERMGHYMRPDLTGQAARDVYAARQAGAFVPPRKGRTLATKNGNDQDVTTGGFNSDSQPIVKTPKTAKTAKATTSPVAKSPAKRAGRKTAADTAAEPTTKATETKETNEMPATKTTKRSTAKKAPAKAAPRKTTAKKATGRVGRYGPEVEKKVGDLMRRGQTRGQIAEALGMPGSTVQHMMNRQKGVKGAAKVTAKRTTKRSTRKGR